MDEMVRRLRALRNSAAEEIDKASLGGERGVLAAVVRARDALNDALVAAGDPEAIASAQTHCSLDEMRGMADGDPGLPDGMSP